MDFLDSPGILGTRASLMMDVVVLAMVLALPVLAVSIYLVKYRRNYVAHKRIQLVLGITLGIAVLLFEVHVRLHGWTERAITASRPEIPAGLWSLLAVHVCLAVSTTGLLAITIVQGLRSIPNPPRPCAYSPRHRVWGRVTATGLMLTSVTGWIFYWIAFVAG